MDRQELSKILEALLFSSQEPIPVRRLKDAIGKKVEGTEIRDTLKELKGELDLRAGPLQLREVGQGFQLATRPEYAQWIRSLRGTRKARISKAGLEVLAIVAYKQPVTKAEMEAVRGVDCGGSVSTLLNRNLIKIAGRKDAPGRPIMYGTTKEFLQYFGLRTIGDMPKISEIPDIVEGE